MNDKELEIKSNKFIKEFNKLLKDGKHIELKEEILKFNAICEELITKEEKEEILNIANVHLSELNDIQLFFLPENIEDMNLSPCASINFSYPIAKEIIKRQCW